MGASCASCSGTMNVSTTNDSTCSASGHAAQAVTFTTATNAGCNDLIPMCSATALYSITTSLQASIQSGSQPTFQCNGAGTGYDYNGGVVTSVCCYTISNTISSGINRIYANYLILVCASPCTQSNLGTSGLCTGAPTVTPVNNEATGCTDLAISCKAGEILTENDVGSGSQNVPGSPPTDSLVCQAGAYNSSKFGLDIASIKCTGRKLI
jgi:hypothetical protein